MSLEIKIRFPFSSSYLSILYFYFTINKYNSTNSFVLVKGEVTSYWLDYKMSTIQFWRQTKRRGRKTGFRLQSTDQCRTLHAIYMRPAISESK
jgi:hypothetical protein